MPECKNCGGFVSEKYCRVFVPDSKSNPECCPNCEDMMRRNGLPEAKKVIEQ